MNSSSTCPGKQSLRLIEEVRPCEHCTTQQRCLKNWLGNDSAGDIGQVIHEKGTFRAGQAIYQMEDRFRSLFIVQSGLVKVEKTLLDGTNHVNGFYFPGELFGVDSIGDACYGYDAIALESTRICEISYERLEALGSSMPRLQQLLVSLLGNKVHQANSLLLDGRYLSAEKRLLLFLKSLCERHFIQTQRSRGRLHLPMTKTDIASYLGIRPESVSRALTNLQRQGVIRNHLRYIEINDINAAVRAICTSQP
jgi:CRP/FNR family transcriptional regulator